ncbi:hypothetical protein D3C87_1347650 [compost metagenome]
MYKIITPVATEPVSRQEAKLHCRVIADVADVTAHPEDASFDAWIIAAREFSEHYTGRAFATQTLEMGLPCFPEVSDEAIDLDLPPVATITSVKYTDGAGVEQTIPGSSYALSTYGDSRRLAPTYSIYWPSTQGVPDAVRIRYVTGYATLPQAARAALLLLVGHLYENRQDVSALSLHEIPVGARSLLDTIKIWSK